MQFVERSPMKLLLKQMVFKHTECADAPSFLALKICDQVEKLCG